MKRAAERIKSGETGPSGLAAQRRHAIPLCMGLLVVSAAVVLVQWPVLSVVSTLKDDRQYLIDNPLVQNPGWESAKRFLGLPPYNEEILKPSTVKGYYQPLAMISLMLDYARVDHPQKPDDPANLRPFRQTSLALHVMNTALVVVLLYALFGQPWPALIAGLIFGVHPSTVESVAWLSDRKTLLATFFALWSLLAYVRYARAGGWGLYAAAIALYVLALLSKPTTTPLPALMFLLDVWPIQKLRWRSVLDKLPLLAIALVSAYVTFKSQANTAAVLLPQADAASALLPQGTSFLRVPFILCHNIVFYLFKFLCPIHMTTHYGFPVPFDASSPMVLTGIVGTLVLLVIILNSLWWTRALAVSWAFFFVAIFPTLGVIGFTDVIAADRFNYLPSIGFLLALTWGLGRLWQTGQRGRPAVIRRIAVVAAALAATSGLSAATRAYLAIWKETEPLHRHMVALAPQAAEAHYSLGVVLLDRSEIGEKRFDRKLLEEALREFETALKIRPDYFVAHTMLGNAYLNRGGPGDLDAALASYRDSLLANPGNPNATINTANALRTKGAAEHREIMRRGQPERARRARAGRLSQAIQLYRNVLARFPENFEARVNLGSALTDLGQYDEAIRHLRAGLELRPRDPATLNNLAFALTKVRRYDEAIRYYQEAVGIRPDLVTARYNLGQALEEQGRTAEALEQYRQILNFDPTQQGARRRLRELTNQGQP